MEEIGETMNVGLAGYARSGKDSVASMLSPEYERRAFADPIREALLVLNPPVTDTGDYLEDVVRTVGWDEAKETHPMIRVYLQTFGKEVGRDMWGEDFWVNIAMKGVEFSSNVVFTDVRFPNEAQAIKKTGGAIWRINREGTEPWNWHESETAMDDWSYDRIIHNDGTLEELREQIGCGEWEK